MAVKIGHAVMDENGKAGYEGEKTGDQTGKEICTRYWYDKDWNVYLECMDEELAKKAAEIMEQICNDPSYGYSQPRRWDGYKSIVKNGGDISKGFGGFDCSSLVIACYVLAGLKMAADGYTGNMRARLLATGKFRLYQDSKHLKSDKYATIGGIYLKEGSHVVMALENGSAVSKTQYFKKYTGKSGSIVDALGSIGEKSSYSYRKTIAKANGITGYYGTAAQNTKMLNLLKSGKLIKP